MAMLNALSFIKNNCLTLSKVNIFTDCQLVLQYLEFKTYPKYNNIRLIMQAILRTLILIQHKNPKTNIIINKVKSHSNISGNNIIDKAVRQKAYKTKYKRNQFQYISYSVTLTQIHKFITKKWKVQWKEKSNPIRTVSKFHSKFDFRIHRLITTQNLITTNVA